MKHSLFFLFFSTFVNADVLAQWNEYEATWEELPGRMLVHMDLEQNAPFSELPYLIEYTQAIFECPDSNYPTLEEERAVDEVSMGIQEALTKEFLVEHAGRFFYQCNAKDYFYVNDTLGVSKILQSGFRIKSTFKVLYDPEWNVFLNFIYPDKYLIQTMNNRVVIEELQNAPDFDLNAKHELKHHAAFSDEFDRKKFRTFLLELNFKIIDEYRVKGEHLQYRISFTRKDQLDLTRLSNITLRLDQRAKALLGRYDGWEITLLN